MNTVMTSLDADGLYARRGKPLEQSHAGEYIAISQDGRVIVGADDVAVMDQAIQDFGSGNFIFRRIGYSYVDKLRWGDAGQLEHDEDHHFRKWMALMAWKGPMIWGNLPSRG